MPIPLIGVIAFVFGRRSDTRAAPHGLSTRARDLRRRPADRVNGYRIECKIIYINNREPGLAKADSQEGRIVRPGLWTGVQKGV
jgi:hypothetical protein